MLPSLIDAVARAVVAVADAVSSVASRAVVRDPKKRKELFDRARRAANDADGIPQTRRSGQ